jgi:hypothetical protein
MEEGVGEDLALEEGLAHKIGMGKALGLGSCQMMVDKQQSRLSLAAERYSTWGAAGSVTGAPWATFKPALREVTLKLV